MRSTPDEKKLFIRQVDVYAAYLAYTDHEIGRVIQAVEDMGKLDNTLIIYISGDNGSSAEGTLIGTPNEVAMFNGVEVPVEDQLKYFYDAWGTRQDLQPHGRAVDVGVRHAVQVDQADRLALRRHAAGHVHLLARPHQGRAAASATSSITSLTSCRRSSKPPASARRKMVDGIKQKPIEGVSMAYTFDKANADKPLDAQDAVLRDDGRPRHLSRGLDASTKPIRPPWVVSRSGQSRIRSTASSGNSTT